MDFLISESLYRALEESTFFVSKYEVQVKTYFLQKSKYGLRVQVSRFVDKRGSLSREKDTVEIKLLIGGGGVVIDKTFKSITLEKPTRKMVEECITDFLENASEYCKQSEN